MIIFALTVYRTLQSRRFRDGHGLLLSGSGLLDLVWRDGAIYFVTMALSNVGNIVTFYLLDDGLRGVLSTFAGWYVAQYEASALAGLKVICSISVTMMSRLMLNLYEAATPSTTADIPADLTRTVTMFFTTRLEGFHDELHENEYEAAPPRTVSSHGTISSSPRLSMGGGTTIASSTPRDWDPPNASQARQSQSSKEYNNEYTLNVLRSDPV